MRFVRGGTAMAVVAVAVVCGSGRAAYADGVADPEMLQSLSNGLCLTNDLGQAPVFTLCQYTQHGFAVGWEKWIQVPVSGMTTVRLWNGGSGCLRYGPPTWTVMVEQCDFSANADLTGQWYVGRTSSGWTVRSASGWWPFLQAEPGASRPSVSVTYSDVRTVEWGL